MPALKRPDNYQLLGQPQIPTTKETLHEEYHLNYSTRPG